MKKTTLMLLGLALAFGVQADVVYQDSFDNDGLGTNTGIGGGAAQTQGGGSWGDDGDATYNNTGTGFRDSSLLYSTNSFQSDGGFELTVYYTASSTTTLTGRNIFGFGLMENAAGWTAANDDSPVGELSSVYSIGVHVTREIRRGLNFADGSTLTQLGTAGFTAGSSTPVVIRVEADGSGGADWSYSVGGASKGSGNIASFDFSKSFNFVAYGQDDEVSKTIQSVTLDAIPEPAALTLVAMTGLGFLYLKRRFS